MVQFSVVPGRMALVNVDIQNCFVEGTAPDGMAVLERVNRLARVCRDAGIAVFHARHALPAGTDPGVLGEIFPIVRDGFLDRDSDTAAFHDGLVRDPQDILLEKPHFGAFHDTDLEQQLRGHGVDTIIITVSRPISAARPQHGRPQHGRPWCEASVCSSSATAPRREGYQGSRVRRSRGLRSRRWECVSRRSQRLTK